MAGDKKISELELLTVLGLEDYVPIVTADTPETYRTTLASIKAAIQGTDFGSELFFSYGVPSNVVGRNIDVYFDLTEKAIYQKISGVWSKKVLFETKRFTIDFTSTEGQTTFQSNSLKGSTIKHLFIDGFRNGVGYSLDTVTGIVTFDSPLNVNCKITLMYV